jgi:hypothetical protein
MFTLYSDFSHELESVIAKYTSWLLVKENQGRRVMIFSIQPLGSCEQKKERGRAIMSTYFAIEVGIRAG